MPFKKNLPAFDPEFAEPEGLRKFVVEAGALGLQLERVKVRLAKSQSRGSSHVHESETFASLPRSNLAVAWNCFTSLPPPIEDSGLEFRVTGGDRSVTSTSSFSSFLRVDVCTKTSLMERTLGATGEDHVADQSPRLQGRRAVDHASRIQEHLGRPFGWSRSPGSRASRTRRASRPC